MLMRFFLFNMMMSSTFLASAIRISQRNNKTKLFHKALEEKLEAEVTQVDQKVVLELDQLVSDQQATLQRAGVPLFSITNNPDDIRLQMYILDFIQRLDHTPS